MPLACSISCGDALYTLLCCDPNASARRFSQALTVFGTQAGQSFPSPAPHAPPRLRHELLPVRIHGVEGEGQTPVGASEHHVADRLHSAATHFDQRLFQGLSQTEDL